MEYIVSKEEMKKYDDNTSSYFQLSSEILMERAALSSVEEIAERCTIADQRVLIVAGGGNNGGDGIAIGRLLSQRNAKVTLCFTGMEESCTRSTRLQLQIYRKYGYEITDHIPQKEYDIIIDALFGIGLNRKVEGKLYDLIQEMNQLPGMHVAIDIPSGIDADTGRILGIAFQADLTITFGFKKCGQIMYPGATYCGAVICKDIGITMDSFLGEYPQMYSYQPDDIKKCLPKRRNDGNKGSFGKVLMIAGSLNMSGACILAGLAAYRTGTGLVRVYTTEKNRVIVQKKLPEAVLKTYGSPFGDKDRDTLKENMDWADTILIGPGIGITEEANQIVENVFQYLDRRKIVIDADALNIIAASPKLKASLIERKEQKGQVKLDIIMTPHMGEFSRLTGKTISELKENIVEEAVTFAEKYGIVLVCKDARTICTDGKMLYLNQSGNDGMATAGSGDVLSGMITALFSQGLDALQASTLGVYLHGIAGNRACEKGNRYALMARDLIKQLPKIM